LQPSLPFSKVASGSGSWRVENTAKGEALFWVILDGAVRLSLDGGEPIDLQKNDFVLIPAAYQFAVSGNDGGDGEATLQETVTKRPDETRHGDPDGPPNARMLVGRLAFGSPDANLLVSLLPRLIHVRGEQRLAALVNFVRGEAQHDRPARDMVLQRLLEVLLIEALRSSPRNDVSSGLMRGLADDRLAVAIRRMHADPRQHWTVEQLASEAGLSRSVFFERFKRLVGVAPMEYLSDWRIALAKKLLRGGDGGLQAVADRVGYGSASAFSVAFTRNVGMPPMQYARQSGLRSEELRGVLKRF
jgi:AraC-like DNA-binding protein